MTMNLKTKLRKQIELIEKIETAIGNLDQALSETNNDIAIALEEHKNQTRGIHAVIAGENQGEDLGGVAHTGIQEWDPLNGNGKRK